MSHLKFKLQVWWDEYQKGRNLSGIRPTGFHKSNPFLCDFGTAELVDISHHTLT